MRVSTTRNLSFFYFVSSIRRLPSLFNPPVFLSDVNDPHEDSVTRKDGPNLFLRTLNNLFFC